MTVLNLSTNHFNSHFVAEVSLYKYLRVNSLVFRKIYQQSGEMW